MTTQEMLQAHLERMHEIEIKDIQSTEQVLGTLKHVAERFLNHDLQVAKHLEPPLPTPTLVPPVAPPTTPVPTP